MFPINWLGLLGRFWYVIPILALTVSTGYYKHSATSEHTQRVTIQAEFEQFKVGVRLAGEAQVKKNQEHEVQDKLNKDNSDKSNEKLKSDLALVSDRLRRTISDPRSSVLPEVSPSSPSPNEITFIREALDGAIRKYEEGVLGLLEEGDKALIDLKTAQEWAQQRQQP